MPTDARTPPFERLALTRLTTPRRTPRLHKPPGARHSRGIMSRGRLPLGMASPRLARRSPWPGAPPPRRARPSATGSGRGSGPAPTARSRGTGPGEDRSCASDHGPFHRRVRAQTEVARCVDPARAWVVAHVGRAVVSTAAGKTPSMFVITVRDMDARLGARRQVTTVPRLACPGRRICGVIGAEERYPP